MGEGSEQSFNEGRHLRAVGLVACILVAVIVLAGSVSTLSASLGTLVVTDVNVSVGVGDTGDGGSNEIKPVIGEDTNNSGGAQTAGESLRIDRVTEDPIGNYDIHFIVRSDQSSHWRLTAYDSYEIDAWTRSGSSPIHEVPPGRDDREVLSHEVTLKSPAVAVPHAYRLVDIPDAPEVKIERDGEAGLHLEEPAEPGDTFLLTSIEPEKDQAVLQEAGTDYNNDIQQRYTALPDNIPEIVEQRTSSIVNSTDSPYRKAVTIESWFRDNYNFTFDVSPPEDELTATLLANRSAANSKYFATAMTVMLRSEGVPARYVVGYTAGEPDPNTGTYTVRGIHTHSWVEVYFPDHGWVPFDPTPLNERAEVISELLDNESTDGSVGSEMTTLPERNNKSAVDADEEGEEGQEEESQEGQEDETNEESQEGQEDETNEESQESQEDETNEESQESQGSGGSGGAGEGEEDGDGFETSEGEGEGEALGEGNPYQIVLLDDPIPGTEVSVQLEKGDTVVSNAAIEVNNEFSGWTDESGTHTFEVPFEDTLEVSGYNVASGRPSRLVTRKDANATTVQDIPTELTISVDGRMRPEEDITTTVTIEGRPVENADIKIEGALVDRTDANGTVTYPLPTTSENVTIVAERGAATGETTLRLSGFTVSVDAWPAVFPGIDATAEVTYEDGTPVSDVGITKDGELIGTTGDNGTVAFSPGFVLSETVTATQEEMTASTTISPLWNLVIGLAGFTLLLVVLGFGTRLAGISPTRIGRSGAATTAQFLMIAVIKLSRIIDRLWQSVSGSAGSPVGWVLASSKILTSEANDDTHRQGYQDSYENPGLVRRAWWRLVSLTPVSKPETSTPGEVANVAKRSGFPRCAVDTILRAFRAVQYGNRDPEEYADDDDIETAIESLEDD